MPGLAIAALWMGLCGGMVALGALVAMAALTGVWPLAPVNATAHWLYGPGAAEVTRLTVRETGVGLATHFAASILWAAVLLGVASALAPVRRLTLLVLGLAFGGIALVVDYGILPTHLSPGWHLVLPWPAVIPGLVALGLGLAAGGCAARLDRIARGAVTEKGPA